MTFGDYYRKDFRTDIVRFMTSIPAESRNHIIHSGEFTIQREMLTKDTTHLDCIVPKHRDHFAVALFFTVLVDQVCYTHYRGHYEEFRALTIYPKLIGDCPGDCQYHLHPGTILKAINSSLDGQNTGRRPDVDVFRSIGQAVGVMKAEVFDFFTRHMPSIDPSEFWQRCVDELSSGVKKTAF